jgi:hypothetical protein
MPDGTWQIGTRYVSDLASCRFGHRLPGGAFAASRSMARSMRDREIVRNGVCVCAGAIQLARVPTRIGKAEKGGA